MLVHGLHPWAHARDLVVLLHGQIGRADVRETLQVESTPRVVLPPCKRVGEPRDVRVREDDLEAKREQRLCVPPLEQNLAPKHVLLARERRRDAVDEAWDRRVASDCARALVDAHEQRVRGRAAQVALPLPQKHELEEPAVHRHCRVDDLAFARCDNRGHALNVFERAQHGHLLGEPQQRRQRRGSALDFFGARRRMTRRITAAAPAERPAAVLFLGAVCLGAAAALRMFGAALPPNAAAAIELHLRHVGPRAASRLCSRARVQQAKQHSQGS